MSKINLTENACNEFKEKWTDRALEDIAAFSNSEGGTVWIGVRDNGEVIGCDVSRKTVDKITNKIRDNLINATFDIKRSKHGNKEILRIDVKKSQWLVDYKGRYFERVIGTNRLMSKSERDKRLLQQSGKTWDTLLSKLDVSTVDEKAIDHFQRLALKAGRISEAIDDPESILQNLDLIRESRLTNAGILLFTKKPQRFFPNTEIQIAQFRGDAIFNSATITGPILKQLEETLLHLQRVVEVKFEIDVQGMSVQDFQRKDVWPYPVNALREAILNAIVHRDYMVAGNIQIKVYDDRLVIWNPGSLPRGLVPDHLYQNHQSIRRNPLLANALHVVGLIERWGRGTVEIVKAFKRQGLPTPIFEEVEGGFRVVLLKDPYVVEKLRSRGLKERQIQAVLYMKENGRITNKRYRELVQISDEAARKDLTELIEMGLVSRYGRGRGTRYELKIK